MVAAMKVAVEGSSSVNKAARDYRVSRTTLQSRIIGRVLKPKPGQNKRK